MNLLDIDQIHCHIVNHLAAFGITKTKLGEILVTDPLSGKILKHSHARPENYNRIYISRANTFLEKKEIHLQHINALSYFFMKDVTWFLFPPQEFSSQSPPHELCAPKKEYDVADLWLQMYGTLKQLGFSQSEISEEMERLEKIQSQKKDNIGEK